VHKSDTRDQPGVSSHGDRPRCHPRHRHGAEDGTHGNESSWAGKKSPTLRPAVKSQMSSKRRDNRHHAPT